jgi:hypothetical protein
LFPPREDHPPVFEHFTSLAVNADSRARELPQLALRSLSSNSLLRFFSLPNPNASFSYRVHIILIRTEGYLYRLLEIILSSTLHIPHIPLSALLRFVLRMWFYGRPRPFEVVDPKLYH